MKGVGNLQKMLRQAQEMQERIKKEMDEMRVKGSSGGEMVEITLDGNKNIVSIKIDPEVVNKDDVEMLQDLISAAFNDASAQVDDQVKEKMGAMGAGLKIPGLS